MSQNKKVLAYKLFYEVDVLYTKYLHTFGEVGIVHDAQSFHAKLENQAKGCLFMGYADDHGEGIYQMFNLKTQRLQEM